MKMFKRIPLYAGLVTLILSVIISSIEIGSKGRLTNQQTQAQSAQVAISLEFSAPHTLSVLTSSTHEIGGIDVSLSFEKDKIHLLPSTLIAGESFVTSGGWVDEDTSLFQFSALPKLNGTKAGLVAQFQIQGIDKDKDTTSTISVLSENLQSGVLDKVTNTTIPVATSSLTFTIPRQ